MPVLKNNLREEYTSVCNSGEELLKVVAIILVIFSYVTYTLSSESIYVTNQECVLDLSSATTNIQQLILSILRYGSIGNAIFLFVRLGFYWIAKKQIRKSNLYAR